MGLLNRKKCAIGLDIGSSSVKLMELDHDAKADVYRLVSFGVEQLPPEAIVDGAVMNSGAVVDAIRRLIDQHRVKTKEAVVSISGNSAVSYTHLTLPTKRIV